MEKGPTISEIMTFVGTRRAPDWKETISPRHGNEVRLLAMPDYGTLSESELEILDKTVRCHLGKTTDELVEWCHENCPEYQKVSRGQRRAITVESILRAARKTAKQIQKLLREAKEVEEMDELLA